MGLVTIPNTFPNGTVADGPQVNANFQAIVNEFNGGISSANVSTDIVTTSGTQTLSNKTLNVNRSIGAYDNWVTAVDGATVTFDLSAGNKQRVTITGNRTLALSNVQNGHVFLISIIQGGAGANTPTFFSTIQWAGGTAPTVTSTVGKASVFMFIQIATNTYYGFIVGLNV